MRICTVGDDDKPANCKVEVTPEMVAAGIEEICGNWLDLTSAYDASEFEAIVRTVYEKMDALRPSRGCEGRHLRGE